MRPWYALVAVLVGALSAGVIAACGGDDEDPITPVTTQTQEAEALSQSEFISEADDICEEANIAVANLTDTSATGTSSASKQEREIVEGLLDQIQDLQAPDQDQTTLNDFIDSLEKLLDNLESQGLAADRGDTDSLAQLEAEESTIRGEMLSAADEYGFKKCGTEGESTTTGTGTGTTGTGTDTGTTAPTAPAAPVTPEPGTPATPVTPDTGGTGTAPPATPAPDTGTGGTGGTGGITP